MNFGLDPAQLRAVLEAVAKLTAELKRLNDNLEERKPG